MTTLAAGTTLPQQYAALLGGFTGVAMPADPACCIMVIAGESGSGKSSLLRSCPFSFIFNVDGTSCDTKVRGMVWPGVRSDGTPITADPRAPHDPEKGVPLGRPLDWQMILDKTKILIEMAQKDVPGRPKLVALDTLDVAVPMIEAHILNEWNTKYRRADEAMKTDFTDLHGQIAYPWRKNEIVQWISSLRAAGYGVCLCMHIGPKVIYEGNQAKKYLEAAWKLSDNLVYEIERLAEVIGVVEKNVVTTTTQQPVLINGAPVIDPVTKQPRITYQKGEQVSVSLTFESSSLNGLTKKRSGYPSRIPLPRINGWDEFAKIHQQFLQSMKDTANE